MTKLTTVEWMYKELNNCLHREEVSDMIDELREQLLAMEKEQIEEAYDDGVSEGEMRGESDYENEDRFDSCTSSTTYYNETYGGDK